MIYQFNPSTYAISVATSYASNAATSYGMAVADATDLFVDYGPTTNTPRKVTRSGTTVSTPVDLPNLLVSEYSPG